MKPNSVPQAGRVGPDSWLPADSVHGTQRAGTVGIGQDGHRVGASVPKVLTGIPGFDDVTIGGLPRRRATVIAGQAGSAKTVFAGQFLVEGVRRGEPAVFITLEEPARDLRANLSTLGADIATWESEGNWRFVDASPLLFAEQAEEHSLPPYNLETLAAQIGHAVDATGARASRPRQPERDALAAARRRGCTPADEGADSPAARDGRDCSAHRGDRR